MLCSDISVRLFWLGSGTQNTLLWFAKVHVLVWITWFCHLKYIHYKCWNISVPCPEHPVVPHLLKMLKQSQELQSEPCHHPLDFPILQSDHKHVIWTSYHTLCRNVNMLCKSMTHRNVNTSVVCRDILLWLLCCSDALKTLVRPALTSTALFQKQDTGNPQTLLQSLNWLMHLCEAVLCRG